MFGIQRKSVAYWMEDKAIMSISFLIIDFIKRNDQFEQSSISLYISNKIIDTLTMPHFGAQRNLEMFDLKNLLDVFSVGSVNCVLLYAQMSFICILSFVSNIFKNIKYHILIIYALLCYLIYVLLIIATFSRYYLYMVLKSKPFD